MATITEDYVSFETAKLLKEKEFNEGCSFVVNAISKCVMPVSWPTTNSDIEDEEASIIALPTLQMAMKWLREVHNLHIMVNCVGKVNYDPIIQRFDGKDFEVEGTEVGTTKQIGGKWVNVRQGFKTYEGACEAAIKYCLENLI